jgi:hypothetical protein
VNRPRPRFIPPPLKPCAHDGEHTVKAIEVRAVKTRDVYRTKFLLKEYACRNLEAALEFRGSLA